jgi:hypothetical protein
MTCPTGKRRYPTRAAARTFARRYRGPHRRAYWCQQCDAWHLGRLTRARKQGRDAA